MKVVDMHCDTVLALYRNQREQKQGDLFRNEFHIDLEKMQRGDYFLQNFAMYVNLKKEQEPFSRCLELIDTLSNEVQKHSSKIRLVQTYDEIMNNWKENVMSAMLTVEEGGVIQGSLENLKELYRRGVRMMTLTWNYPNEIGYPNCLTPHGEVVAYGGGNQTNGLTDFGLKVVAMMEELGIIIDVSHLSDAGFYDVLANTSKPFVASHSNSRALCPHIRNLTDDMIRKLSDRGGVLGLNYEASFLNRIDESKSADNTDHDKGDRQETMTAMVAQVKHIINVGGYECLGLGSDFDGIETPYEMKDASYLPRLAYELEHAGLSVNQIEAIFHKNVLRIYRELL
jgi:membrane dipeptidase